MNVYKNAYPDLEKAVQLEKEQKLWSDLTKFEETVADLFKWWRNSGGRRAYSNDDVIQEGRRAYSNDDVIQDRGLTNDYGFLWMKAQVRKTSF